MSPLTNLGIPADFDKLVEAFGGHGKRVEKPEQLSEALARAVQIARDGKQAVINVLCSPI